MSMWLYHKKYHLELPSLQTAIISYCSERDRGYNLPTVRLLLWERFSPAIFNRTENTVNLKKKKKSNFTFLEIMKELVTLKELQESTVVQPVTSLLMARGSGSSLEKKKTFVAVDWGQKGIIKRQGESVHMWTCASKQRKASGMRNQSKHTDTVKKNL